MRNKRAIMMAALCTVLFCVTRGWADNITVSNAKVTDQVKGSHGMVRFNVQWENSWRKDLAGPGNAEPYNYDAAWVFVKYRVGKGEWKHAMLSTNVVDHVVPSGCSLSVGQTEGPSTTLPPSPGSYGEARGAGNGAGVFIYRSANGTGTFAVTNVGLRWQYPSNGLDASAAVKVKVFAIEMVYVPQDAFWVGDGNTKHGEFYEGDANRPISPAQPAAPPPPTTPELSMDGEAAPDLRAKTLLDTAAPVPLPTFKPLRITNENALAVGDSAGQLYYMPGTNKYGAFLWGDNKGPIPAAFPKGYAAFYGMKYEISQGQYVDFLNTLLDAQARNRQHCGNHFARYAIFDVSGVYPSGFPAAADTSPGEVVCGKYVTSRPYVACNWMTWPDLAAYLDWAGLRPMTELEYEKACRGPLPPVAGEYAWGYTYLVPATNIINSGLANEGPCNTNANCCEAGWLQWNGEIGPMRVGCMGMGTGDRTRMGAGYYGMLDLTGNVWEKVVSVGDRAGRSFTGLHGDGVLNDTTGDAHVPTWPVAEGTGNGIAVRGAFSETVSHRERPNHGGPSWYKGEKFDYDYIAQLWGGGRGVRTAP